MPEYHAENEAIEGKKIFCTFEHKPSRGIEKVTKREQITIAGNPATAILTQIWEYKKQ